MSKYRGITWFDPKSEETEEDLEMLLKMWKDTKKCGNGMHLFDEVKSLEDHYLSCDSCGLMVFIDRIDDRYVEKGQ